MDKRWFRLAGWALVWVVGCGLWWWNNDPVVRASTEQWTVPSVPPELPNPGFECSVGYYSALNPDGKNILVPNGWTVVYINGSPQVSSTRIFFSDKCDGNSSTFIEHLNGNDSF